MRTHEDAILNTVNMLNTVNAFVGKVNSIHTHCVEGINKNNCDWNKEIENKLHAILKENNTKNPHELFPKVDELVQKFNKVYAECGYLIAEYFGDEKLLAMYNFVDTILQYLQYVFDDTALSDINKVYRIERGISFMHRLNDTIIMYYNHASVRRDDEARLTCLLSQKRAISDTIQANNVVPPELKVIEVEEKPKIKTIIIPEIPRNENIILKQNTSIQDKPFEADRTLSIWHADADYSKNIRKMINNLCSQITSENPKHTIHRLKEFLSFLSGHDIPLIGSNGLSINIKRHPDASKLAWICFHQAVLVQAETQFASSISTSVAFASVVSAIFGKYPDQFGSLLTVLGKKYPVLTDRNVNDTEDDQTLTQLRGTARFLAALAIAKPPPNFVACSKISPAFLWSLLSRISSDLPTTIAAEACVGLLEVGGSALWAVYGKQFTKLLVSLLQLFKGQGGISGMALEFMISNALDTKQFEHLGYLTKEFWFAQV